MAIKAIVFDWDGTLFNSMEYKRKNFVDLFSKYNISSDELIRFHTSESGIPRQDLFNKCLLQYTGTQFSHEEYELISQKYTLLNLHSSKTTSPFPDVKEGLEALKKRGLKLFVSSSSAHDELTEVTKHSGLNNYFDEVLGSQNQLKKGPGHIDYICKKYNLKKEELIFIGDDEQDLMLGKLANVRTVKIVRNNSNLYHVKKIQDLILLLN